jgi:hypothetical protein
MKLKLATIIISLIFLTGKISAQQTSESTSDSKRGFFTLGLDYSSWQHRLLNSNGIYSALDGSGVGLHVDIALWDSSAGDFRIFGVYRSGTVYGTKQPSDQMDITELLYGLKILTANFLYVQAAYGTINQSIKTSTLDESGDNNLLMIGAGVEFNVWGNVGMTIGGDFRANVSKQTGDMAGLSHSDAMSFNIGFF